jgi:hypothetical protein
MARRSAAAVEAKRGRARLHLAPGRVFAGFLRFAGYSGARAFCDVFSVGPVARSLPRLESLRRGFWGERVAGLSDYRAGELARVVDECRGDAVLWTTPSWLNRLSLWWLLDALGTGALGLPLAYSSRAGVVSEYLQLSRREIAGCLSSARSIDARMIAEARMLWRAFAAREPRGLVQLPWRSLRAFADARPLFAAYARVLPRERTSGRGPRWRLSWLDETLIRHFARRRWTTPHQWMRAEPRAMDLFAERGDVDLLERMLELTQGRQALLESRAVPGKVGQWTRVELRLSEVGERALKLGIDDVGSIPARPIGGHAAYRSPRWIAVRTGPRWSIAEAT